MRKIYYCLTCKKRVDEKDVSMEDLNTYKHFQYYMQSGKHDYVLHPVKVMYENDKE